MLAISCDRGLQEALRGAWCVYFMKECSVRKEVEYTVRIGKDGRCTIGPSQDSLPSIEPGLSEICWCVMFSSVRA